MGAKTAVFLYMFLVNGDAQMAMKLPQPTVEVCLQEEKRFYREYSTSPSSMSGWEVVESFCRSELIEE